MVELKKLKLKLKFRKRHTDTHRHIRVEPGRKGNGQKIGNFILYILGSLDHLYIFCFAGNCHVFGAYRGESYYGI